MWISRVLLYIAVLAAPLVASALQPPTDTDPFVTELATRLALLGLTILAMQFVISARIKWVERPFGLDEIFRFHKAMAVFAAIVLLAHPLLLAASDGKWALITSLNQDWPILLGKVTIALLVILVLVSLFRAALRFEFQKWRMTHNVVAGTVLAVGFTHGFFMTGGLEEVVVRAMLAGVAVFGVLAYLNHVLIVPMRARRNAYTVTRVQQETHNVWTIELTPPHGGQVPDYLPGQFHFLTLYREAGLRAEEHPFTISSSPTTRGRLTSTIKESGDFTSTIGRTKPGGGVAVQGPFGRFSTSLHPGQRDLVFIAGGIGITPLMSMLRYMRDTRPDTTVHLLCFNRTGEDIVFRDELAAIEAGDAPRLRVTHILSRPNDSWQGERGVATRDLLARLIDGDITTKAYYVCGPPPMMNVVIRALHDLGVPTPKVYYELFAL